MCTHTQSTGTSYFYLLCFRSDMYHILRISIVSEAKVNQTYFKHRTMAHQEGSLEALATWQPPWKVSQQATRNMSSGCVVLDRIILNIFDLFVWRKVQKVLKNWQVEADNIAVAWLQVLRISILLSSASPQPLLSLPILACWLWRCY